MNLGRIIFAKIATLILPALAAVILNGCTRDTDPSITINEEETFTLEFGTGGGEKSVAIDATSDWSAEGMPDWVTVTPSSGKAGASQVAVKVSESETGGRREAKVRFVMGDLTAMLTIDHTTEALLEARPEELVVPNEGGEVSFSISANTAWSLEPESGSEQYIDSISTESGTADEQVTVDVKANGSVDDVVIALLLSTTDTDISPRLERRIVITQSADTVVLEAETVEGTVYAPREGGEIKFAVMSNISWKLALRNSGDSKYIDRFSPSTGNGNGEVSVFFKPNSSLDVITFEMVLSSDDSRVSPAIERRILFSQTNSTPELTVDPASFTIPTEGGQAVFQVTANTPWKISLDDQNQSSLVKRFSTTTGTGNKEITIDFNPNPSVSPAIIGMKVESTDPSVVPAIARRMTFELAGTEPILDVDGQNISISGLGGMGTFGITSNMKWKVAPKNPADEKYIESLSENSGTGNAKITVRLKENTTAEPLTVILEVRSDNPDVSPAIVREVKVSQSAGVPPAKPAGVVCTMFYDSAEFSWNYVERATGYEIEVGDKTVTTDRTSGTVTGLEPGREYHWRMRAVRNKTYSDWVEGDDSTEEANHNARNSQWNGNWSGTISESRLTSGGLTLNVLDIIDTGTPAPVTMAVSPHPTLDYRNNVSIGGGLTNIFPATALRNTSVVNTGDRNTLEDVIPSVQRIEISINKLISNIPEIMGQLTAEEAANIIGIKIMTINYTARTIDFMAKTLKENERCYLMLTANGSVTANLSGGNADVRAQVADKVESMLTDTNFTLMVSEMTK